MPATPAKKPATPRKPAAARKPRGARDTAAQLRHGSCCDDWMKAHHDRRIALAKVEREARS